MKILLLDIETAPNVAHVWGLWQQNIGLSQIQASGYTMCWSAKWYGDKEVMFDSVQRSSTKKMLRKIHKLLDEADVVVSYNGKKFDLPTLNKEFILQGMTPPSPYRHVDLLTTARGQFRWASNKLDYVANALGLGTKVKHQGHELWVRCMAKDVEAWETMERYNRGDVVLLERVYDKMMPWIKSHPNHSSYGPDSCCPNCGHDSLQRRGTYHTVANTYARYCCNGCGAWSRAPFSNTRREERERILRGVS